MVGTGLGWVMLKLGLVLGLDTTVTMLLRGGLGGVQTVACWASWYTSIRR